MKNSRPASVHRELMVVLPVGPDNDGAETIDSIFTYCTASVTILAIDDSKDDRTKRFLETVDPRVVRLPSAGFKGIRGALFCSIAQAYDYALKHYTFDVLLRIDTDALITGPAPENDALAFFAAEPTVGMIGSYRHGYHGELRDFGIVAEGISWEASWHGLRYFNRWRRLRKWLESARARGYVLGEHCLGAIVYMRPQTLQAMQDAGDFSADEFYCSCLSEDHLFSLLTIRHGYRLEAFSNSGVSAGVRWKGLPDSPENLTAASRKLVHSIKFYEDMKEKDVRAFFTDVRARYKASTLPAALPFPRKLN